MQASQAAGQLGLSDECAGFVIDGVPAVPWEDCSPEGDKEIEVRYSRVTPDAVLTKCVRD